MPNNKALTNNKGPDGTPAEIYKHFWQAVSPLFSALAYGLENNSKTAEHINGALV